MLQTVGQGHRMPGGITRVINGDEYHLRQALDEQSKVLVYSLRYSAYLDAGAIEPNDAAAFKDRFDDQENCINHLMTRNGVVVAAIRSCFISADRKTTSLGYMNYTQEVESHCAYHSIVESNRFVVNPDFDRLPLETYILLFAAILEHRNIAGARFLMTAVRPKHMGLYRRLLNFAPWSLERVYPGLKVPMVLLGGDYDEDGQKVIAAMPSLILSSSERDNFVTT